jgi:hypothetical protein
LVDVRSFTAVDLKIPAKLSVVQMVLGRIKKDFTVNAQILK